MTVKTKKKDIVDQPRKSGIVTSACPKALVDTERILTQLRSEATPHAEYKDANVVHRQHLRLPHSREERVA